MVMDFGPQKPGEHDFEYAARILKAAGTKFEALLANGSFSLQDLRDIKEQVESVIRRKIDYMLEPRERADVVPKAGG